VLAGKIRFALAQSIGASDSFLKPAERDQLQVATNSLSETADLLARATNETNDMDILRQMLETSGYLNDACARIAGRLQYWKTKEPPDGR